MEGGAGRGGGTGIEPDLLRAVPSGWAGGSPLWGQHGGGSPVPRCLRPTFGTGDEAGASEQGQGASGSLCRQAAEPSGCHPEAPSPASPDFQLLGHSRRQIHQTHTRQPASRPRLLLWRPPSLPSPLWLGLGGGVGGCLTRLLRLLSPTCTFSLCSGASRRPQSRMLPDRHSPWTCE